MISVVKPFSIKLKTPAPVAASIDSPCGSILEHADLVADAFISINVGRDSIPPMGEKTREVELATYYRQSAVLSRKNP
jgi:hypothetical protein